MDAQNPTTRFHPDFSSPQAAAVPWEQAEETLERAEIFWISTVRPDGRPHVTPLIAVWQDGALFFCTGPQERKARNLAANPHCTLTTGCNHFSQGLDIVVEGQAAPVHDEARLQALAAAYDKKYNWHYEVQDGLFVSAGLPARVYAVRPRLVFGFGREGGFSQTSYRFA